MSQYTSDAATPTISLVEPREAEFSLDRDGAIDAISQVWGLDPADRYSWWIGGFGSGLAESVEMLTRVVFSPRRALVDGPGLEILVLPVMPDSPAQPVMVGIVDGNGPILCRGIEDLAETLPDAFTHGPEHVLGGLETLLDIASSVIPDVERLNEPGPGRPVSFGFEVPAAATEARILGL